MERSSTSSDHTRFSTSLTSPVVISCNGLEITNKNLYNTVILNLQRRLKKMENKNQRLTRPTMKITKNKKKKKSKSFAFAAAVTHDGGGGASNSSSSWVKSQLLGRGGYGSVYLATSKINKTERAIKTAELSCASSLMDEGRILIRLDSPFVVRCYGDETAREENDVMQYNLILEYCSGKTIADLIEDNHGELEEPDVKLFARDVLSGLKYIHDRNIVHCDIKPDNLLLCPTDPRFRPNGYLTKLGDFGLAMEKGSLEYGNGFGHKRGTTRYMAPELMSHGMVDFGVDVWAFGCAVLEMLSGKVVWEEHGDLAFDDWVDLIGHSNCVPRRPVWLSREAHDFLSKCLEKDVNKRWSSHSLANHPFALL